MTRKIMEKILELIEERCDRAILMHENENRHEMSCCFDFSESGIINGLEGELLAMTTED